jgi:hypothetical protein
VRGRTPGAHLAFAAPTTQNSLPILHHVRHKENREVLTVYVIAYGAFVVGLSRQKLPVQQGLRYCGPIHSNNPNLNPHSQYQRSPKTLEDQSSEVLAAADDGRILP